MPCEHPHAALAVANTASSNASYTSELTIPIGEAQR